MGALKVGLLAAGLFIVAVVYDWSSLDELIISLLALLLVAYIWSRLSLQRLGLRRSLDMDRIRVGETIRESITLSNVSLLPKLWIEVRDFSSLPGHQAGRVVNLRSNGQASWAAETVGVRRGRFRLGPMTVSSGDPFGLFHVHKMLPAAHDLVVYPMMLDVSGIHLPAANLSGGQMRQRSPALASPTIAGLREYAPGDPLNRISWSATARRGMMMVKEFDPDPTSDVWIMLDLDEQYPGPLRLFRNDAVAADDPRVYLDTTEEYAVALGASLADRALEEGRKVGLIVNRAMPVRIPADNSQRQWFRIFETLAVAASFGRRGLGEAIAAEAQRFSRNAGLIVVTASVDHSWIPAVRGLVQRRVPVTAVIIDAGQHAEDGSTVATFAEALATARISVHRYSVNQQVAHLVHPHQTPEA